MITTAGKLLLIKLLSGEDNDYISYLAVGTGTTAPTLADTELENESFHYKVAVNISGGVMTVSTYIPTHAPDQVISEAGLVTVDGRLIIRDTFTPITKTSTIPVLLTWTITLAGV